MSLAIAPSSLPAGAPAAGGMLFYDSDRTGNFEVYAADEPGDPPRPLTTDHSWDSWWPRLSPDRRHIAYYRTPRGVHDTDFNQTHHLDLHGSDGTVYAYNDWSTVQEVRGLRSNEPGPAVVMPIPDEIWGHARRDRVHDTYRDVFRGGGAMVGDWIDAIRDGVACAPDLVEGARVQFLLDLAVKSAASDGRLLNARA